MARCWGYVSDFFKITLRHICAVAKIISQWIDLFWCCSRVLISTISDLSAVSYSFWLLAALNRPWQIAMGMQTQCFSGIQNVLPSIWQLVTKAETPFEVCWWNNDLRNHHLQPWNQGQKRKSLDSRYWASFTGSGLFFIAIIASYWLKSDLVNSHLVYDISTAECRVVRLYDLLFR